MESSVWTLADRDATHSKVEQIVRQLSQASLSSSRRSNDSIASNERIAKLDLEALHTFQEQRRLSKLRRRQKLSGSLLSLTETTDLDEQASTGMNVSTQSLHSTSADELEVTKEAFREATIDAFESCAHETVESNSNLHAMKAGAQVEQAQETLGKLSENTTTRKSKTYAMESDACPGTDAAKARDCPSLRFEEGTGTSPMERLLDEPLSATIASKDAYVSSSASIETNEQATVSQSFNESQVSYMPDEAENRISERVVENATDCKDVTAACLPPNNDLSENKSVLKSTQHRTQKQPNTSSHPKSLASEQGIASLHSFKSIPLSKPKQTENSTNSLAVVKGKRKFHVLLVQPTLESLSKSDVFILVAPAQKVSRTLKMTGHVEEIKATLFVWCGELSGKVKRSKGKEVAYRMRERDWGTKAEIVEIVENEGSRHQSRFWAALNECDHLQFATNNQNNLEDADFEKAIDSSMTLYGLKTDRNFTPLITNGHNLSVKLISSEQCYILECKTENVYVWLGRHSKETERAAAVEFGKTLTDHVTYQLRLETDLKESVLFMEKFQDWAETVSIEVRQPKNIAIKDKSRTSFDRGGFKEAASFINVQDMAKPPALLASWERQADGSTVAVDIGGPPPVEMDRGKLSLQCWMAKGSELVEVGASEYGILFSGESYLFLYTHLMGRPGNEKKVSIAYFWVGDGAKMTEKGTIAYAAIELEKKENARQIRVSQGHEPDHFLSIFRPCQHSRHQQSTSLVIRRGPYIPDAHKSTSLFCMGGCSDANVKAIQVAWNISSFNSGAVFLAVSVHDDDSFLWIGDGAHGFERTAALEIAKRLCVSMFFKLLVAIGKVTPSQQKKKGESHVIEIQELCEPPNFWSRFGLPANEPARKHYASVPYLLQRAKFSGIFKRRLWKVSHVVNGGATAEELSPFTQKDLDETHAYILDAFFEVFVWIGKNAKSQFKDTRLAVATAIEYARLVELAEPMRLDSSERLGHELRVSVVQDGDEPMEFKSCFLSFDDGLADFAPAQHSNSITNDSKDFASRAATNNNIENAKTVLDRISAGVFTLQELQNKDALPLGVDPKNVERYLSAADFLRLFKTDLLSYDSLPAWKRLDLKKRAGLF
ncbi:Villin-1 [Chytriomyces hyalinus]|nr:Villin-1 [Chytriomyces hyalinus]